MPHIPPLTDEQASEEAKPLFETLQGKVGMVPNIYRTMGHSPAVMEAAMKMSAAIQNNLPAKLRELAYLKTAMVNECGY